MTVAPHSERAAIRFVQRPQVAIVSFTETPYIQTSAEIEGEFSASVAWIDAEALQALAVEKTHGTVDGPA